MTIKKTTYIDQITVIETGTVLVREVTRIMEDGAEISKQYHRSSFAPASNVSAQPANVQAICAAAWTPEVVAAYVAAQEANQVGV